MPRIENRQQGRVHDPLCDPPHGPGEVIFHRLFRERRTGFPVQQRTGIDARLGDDASVGQAGFCRFRPSPRLANRPPSNDRARDERLSAAPFQRAVEIAFASAPDLDADNGKREFAAVKQNQHDTESSRFRASEAPFGTETFAVQRIPKSCSIAGDRQSIAGDPAADSLCPIRNHPLHVQGCGSNTIAARPPYPADASALSQTAVESRRKIHPHPPAAPNRPGSNRSRYCWNTYPRRMSLKM